MGRASKKVYEYDFEGKYLRKYESISEFRQKYYSEIKGKMPLFTKQIEGCQYQITHDTIAYTERVIREKTLFILKVHNSKLCNLSNTKQSKQPVEMLNLKNEVIAEFASARVAELLLKYSFSKATIYSQLTGRVHEGTKGIMNDYYFRYKQIKE